jgi:uncharacterized protein YkwD
MSPPGIRSSSPAGRYIGRGWKLVAPACLAALVACCDFLDPHAPESPGYGGIEDSVTLLVNDHREALGCGRLRWNPDLATVARAHSWDMLEREYFGHEDPDGRGLAHRLRAAGIQYVRAAENIAMGFRYDDAARAVFEAWLESESHRRIIESCSFTWHGIGFVDYRWTHLFMR